MRGGENKGRVRVRLKSEGRGKLGKSESKKKTGSVGEGEEKGSKGGVSKRGVIDEWEEGLPVDWG